MPPPPPPPPSADALGLLALTVIPGLGPVLIGRIVKHLGSAEAVLHAEPAQLRLIQGLTDKRIEALISARRNATDAAKREADAIAKAGATILGINDPGYPPLLRQIDDPPPILTVRGNLQPHDQDQYALAVVGSRACTQYGREQTARFAGLIAAAGITIVSGGARGIDTAAHQAAIQSGGRTIAVLGCGIARAYPPENRELFDRIADGHGAVISELPVNTEPDAKNFPARNRLITGLSLGVLLIEAATRSGSLISARLAGDDQGREVFAVPGRIDSPASEGTNDLIKSGGAQLVTSPGDIIEALQTPARHAHAGTHQSRYDHSLFNTPQASTNQTPGPRPGALTLNPAQRAIVSALQGPLDLDALVRETGLQPQVIAAELTVLEVWRVITRAGSGGRIERVGAAGT